MTPVIALVGRPNVGKSTLFNRLTQSRDAIVVDLPGVTRDRQYGHGKIGDYPFIVIDTGGIGSAETAMDEETVRQSELAMAEADAILFLVDGKAGLTAADESIANKLRKLEKPVYLVVNKTDAIDADVASADFHQFGMGEPYPISALHGYGVSSLLGWVSESFEQPICQPEIPPELGTEEPTPEVEALPDRIRIAVVGRPNVGKSTLVNRILGEERVVVFDEPGTTRDSIEIPFERRNTEYSLIDTAGVRRRARVKQAIEKFSIIKTLQSIEEANVVIMVMDAQEGISEQDLRLLGYILDAGKALVVALNKWDGLSIEQKDHCKQSIRRRLEFIRFAKIHLISALHGTGVGDLFNSINQAYESAMVSLSASRLTQILEEAVEHYQPPLVQNRRIKLRFAHPGGNNPPTVVIHGNQTKSLPDSYKRYLMNAFREALKLTGTPIRIELKTGSNPFAGRKNKLTARQVQKRDRLRKYSKRRH